MTIAEIIERAHQRTGRKNEGKDLDLTSVVIGCLQDICMEMRWPWRKKWATFTSASGTASYDLTDTAIVTDAVGDLEELITIVRVNSATDMFELEPTTKASEMILAKHSTTTGEPGNYFLEPGTEGTVHLVDIPNAARTYRFLYWAIPNPGLESSDGSILLLPTKYHHVLLQAVIAEFWAMMPGEGIAGPNAAAAYALYLRKLENIKAKNRFSTGEVREFKDKSKAVSSS